jgi:hypothetical protein
VTDRFRRNGARAWLGRVLVAFLIALILAVSIVAAVTVGAAGESARPSALLASFTGLSLVLNLAILAAFAMGSLLVLGWLARAAREESALNRFVTRNEAALREGSELEALSLDGLGRCAVRERVELLGEIGRSGRLTDAAVLSEALLDREEPRVDVARYTAGMLVLLGLLGTFVGLLLTIGGVADVVDGLGVTPDGDIEAFLVQLKVGLRSPLEGMGLAFSTSLLGLSGSLLLGIGALGLSAAQSSWISKLEEATALYLTPESAVAAPAGATALAGGGLSSEVMKQAQSAAQLFKQVQAASAENATRLDASAQRMASAAEGLGERVGALVSQVERVELALARVVDGGAAQRETFNDLGVKLSELVGSAAAARSELHDGHEALGGRLQAGLESLRAGLADSIASGSQQDLARREEARRLARLLEELVRVAGGSTEPRP